MPKAKAVDMTKYVNEAARERAAAKTAQDARTKRERQAQEKQELPFREAATELVQPTIDGINEWCAGRGQQGLGQPRVYVNGKPNEKNDCTCHRGHRIARK